MPSPELAAAWGLAHGLYVRALGGDDQAAAELVQFAGNGALLVEMLYREKPDVIAAVASRREDFPVRHTRDRREEEKRQDMLKSLPFGTRSVLRPTLSTRGRDDETAGFIRFVMYPMLEHIRCTPPMPIKDRDRAAIERRVRGLGSLCKDNRRGWAAAAFDYFAQVDPATGKWQIKMNGRDILAGISQADARRRRIIGRQEKALSKRDFPTEMRRDIARTNIQLRKMPTRGAYRHGFIDAVSKRLDSMLVK